MEAGRWRAIAIAALLVVSTISTSVSFLRPARAQGETDLVAAVQAEVAGEFGVPAGTIIVTVMTEQGAWAYGTGVVPAMGEDGTPRTRFFLAHREGGVWTVALRYTAAFDALLAQAPAEFPSPSIRAALEGFSAAADGSSQLSFPFSTGETWYFLGPHPSTTEVWASLDFSPVFSDRSGAPVLAMRGGVVFRPCANMIMIDHGDGWTTGYYHVININVGNGQIVTRGQKIGGISDQVQCGGFAGGPHVHVWVEFLGQPVAIAGRDIGGWTVENGTQPYEGCLIRGATRRCTSDITNQVTNDGEIGSGGSPALVTLDFLYGEVGLAVPYQISSFPANSSVAISWRRPGGSVVNLGSVNTNARGAASGNITVPPTEGGWKNSIRFTIGSLTRTVFFNIFPSLSVEPDVAGPGEPITVTLRGFAKQSQVTVAYIPESTFEPVAMGMVMTNNTGGATANLMLPADLANGPGIVEATLGDAVAIDDLRIADGSVVWLGATTVRAGSEADYWVARFPADTLLTLKMTAVGSDDVVATLDTVTTDASGEANGTFELPLLPFGMWRVFADTGTVAAEVVVTIAPALYPPLTPVERGSSVDITALGYTANSLVTVLWVNDQGNIPIGSGQADAQGSATVAVTVPPVPDGTITIRGQDETGVSNFSHLDVLGGPLPGPPAAAVTPNRSTVNNAVTYTLSNFPPSSAVQIRWRRTSGSLIDLGTVQTAANGTASGQIQVPATTGGANQQIRFISGAASATALFEVVPRIKVTPSPVERGQQVSVSLRGYGKQEAVRIRWKQGTTWVQVGLVTTSNTGSANASVTVPDWVPNGMTAIRGDGPLFRAQTNAVEVSGGIFTPAEAPAAPTASVTPTPSATTVPSPTVSPEPTFSPTVTAEPATPSPTPEPTATSTAEPTVTPDPSTPGPEATTGVGNDGPRKRVLLHEIGGL